MKTHTSIHRQNIFNSLVNCPKDLIDHGLVSLNSVAWNFFSVSHVDSSTEAFNPASTAFPEPLAGSWIRYGVGGFWTDALVGCPCCPKRLKPAAQSFGSPL